MSNSDSKSLAVLSNNKLKASLVVLPKNEGKKGYKGLLQLPNGTTVFVNLIENTAGSGNKYFSISTFMPEVKDGKFVTTPRKDSDGNFLDTEGKVVEKASDASQSYVYANHGTEDQPRYDIINVGFMNINNSSKDGEEFPQSRFRIQLRNFNHAKQESDLYKQIRAEKEAGNDVSELNKQMQALRSNDFDAQYTMYLNRGKEFFESLGFDVKTPSGGNPLESGGAPAQSSSAPSQQQQAQPEKKEQEAGGMSIDDDIPF